MHPQLRLTGGGAGEGAGCRGQAGGRALGSYNVASGAYRGEVPGVLWRAAGAEQVKQVGRGTARRSASAAGLHMPFCFLASPSWPHTHRSAGRALGGRQRRHLRLGRAHVQGRQQGGSAGRGHVQGQRVGCAQDCAARHGGGGRHCVPCASRQAPEGATGAAGALQPLAGGGAAGGRADGDGVAGRRARGGRRQDHLCGGVGGEPELTDEEGAVCKGRRDGAGALTGKGQGAVLAVRAPGMPAACRLPCAKLGAFQGLMCRRRWVACKGRGARHRPAWVSAALSHLLQPWQPLTWRRVWPGRGCWCRARGRRAH